MAGERQHLMTDGLVLREYPTVADNDRFVAILTRSKGIIRASAKGARQVKSRLGAATRLLCYGDFSLIPAKDKYIVEDAKPKEVFFSLRDDVEKLALAQYFCELGLRFSPSDAPAVLPLRLLLNALFYLGKGEKDPRLIKAVVEGRLMSMEGYMPDLTGCCHCGGETQPMRFSPSQGSLYCAVCTPPTDAIPLSEQTLAAFRYILDGDFEHCFAFTLPPDDIRQLSLLTERFLLAQGQRTFRTLDFYHTLQ